MPTRQVDDDAVGRRLELRRALVVDAQEQEVRVACERLIVRHEAWERALADLGKARVERAHRLSGERVRAERGNLELGVTEHAVERFLT